MRTYLVLLIIFTGFLSGCKKEKPEQIQRIDIIYSGQLFGELEPCLCKTPLGGLARRADFIQQALKDVFSKNGDAVLVDAGNITNTSIMPHDTMKVKAILKIYNFLHYEVVNLGVTDLLLGLDFWKDFLNSYPYPEIISANTLTPDASKYVFKPSFTLTRKNVDIGFIGIVSPRFNSILSGDNKLPKIGNYADIVKSEIKKLREKCEILILLAMANYEDCRKLATIFPDFDAIIGGHTPESLEKPEFISVELNKGKRKNIPLCLPGIQGRSVGILSFYVDLISSKIDSIAGTLVPLDTHFIRFTEVDSILAYEKWEIYKRFKPEPKPLPKGSPRYVGDNSCKKCHIPQVKQWSNTAHSRAWKTLLDENNHYNIDCIKCHVVGYGYESGFTGIEKTPDRINVQCESCHGPAEKHLKNPELPYGFEINETLCLSCHDKEHSINFNFKEYITKVRH